MSRLTEEEIRCQLLWKLARGHGWARWIPEDDLVKTLPRSERGRARREVLTTIQNDATTIYRRRSGYKINHAEIEALACFLRDACGISELRIEATLSHFDGF